jgi:small-conductance mechanosensitive channel
LAAVAQLLQQLLTFLPNVIAAGIVFLLGGLVAQFAGNLVTALANSGGLSYAGRVGRFVQYLISLFTAIIALGVLGIDTALLVTAITIMIGAFGLALGLALGLGARRVVHHVLAGYYVRQQFRIGQDIVLGDQRGQVQSVGGVATEIATDRGSVSVPNGMLLESLVQKDTPPDADAT